MPGFIYTQKRKFTVENGKIVIKLRDAIMFNDRIFTIGDIIGFQYGDTSVVGILESINKSSNTIYVSVKGNYKMKGIYGFELEKIIQVYGTYY